MVNSLKPINLIFFDSYVLFVIYLAMNWATIDCSRYSNIWQLFYYIVLILRLGIDEFENNGVFGRKCYLALIFISSGVILNGMCIYEMYTIFQNPDFFAEDNADTGYCFSNRILLVGQCILGFLIFIKDIVYAICDRPKDEQES